MKTENKSGLHLNKYSCKKCYCESHYTKENKVHTGLYCSNCDSWITWIPKYVGDYVLWFGKFKDKKLNEISRIELESYYKYMILLDLDDKKEKAMNKVKTFLGM